MYCKSSYLFLKIFILFTVGKKKKRKKKERRVEKNNSIYCERKRRNGEKLRREGRRSELLGRVAKNKMMMKLKNRKKI